MPYKETKMLKRRPLNMADMGTSLSPQRTATPMRKHVPRQVVRDSGAS